MEKVEIIQLFEKQAARYEKRRKKKSIDTKWRKKLLEDARGKILEVAVGAGANFQFYSPAVEVTAVDFSPSMIEKAKQAAKEYGIQAEFIVADVESLSFPENCFDTIVSTLTLCSYSQPVQVLNFFNTWCKKDGQILLMEHGISSFGPLAWIQNKMDGWQLRKLGCHANRDILKIVSDSNITIERHESYMLGSVHLIWAKPQK